MTHGRALHTGATSSAVVAGASGTQARRVALGTQAQPSWVDGIERPLKIYCDNNSTVLYSSNNRSTTNSKFIDIKFLVVKERVQNMQISIEHVRTDSMLANPLTKGLVPRVFYEQIAHMGVVPNSTLV